MMTEQSEQERQFAQFEREGVARVSLNLSRGKYGSLSEILAIKWLAPRIDASAREARGNARIALWVSVLAFFVSFFALFRGH